MNWIEVPMLPVPKPRQTRADKWKRRSVVLRYRAFADEIRLRKVGVPEAGTHVIFIIPMPQSWSKKRKSSMHGQPHRQKPDSDNLLKALMDAVHAEDAGVWDVRVTKLWGVTGKIFIGTSPNGIELDTLPGRAPAW